MRLKRSMLRRLATTLAVVLVLTAVTTSAEAGLFTKLKETVKANPIKSALVGVAAVGGAVLAAPYIAGALGFASGAAVAGTGGAVAAVAGAGTGLLGIGGTIWGGLCAAGGFVTGALGAVGAAIGSVFSGIAGFIGGIIGSPLFIPALVIIGVAVVGYLLWKKYKRQNQTISNGSDLPSALPSVSAPATEVAVSGDVGAPRTSEIPPSSSNPVTATTEIPVSGSQEPAPAASTEVAPTTPINASTGLKAAHEAYIRAYNKYINLVTNVGGSENPDEEMRSNMGRSDVQKALTDYREAYNEYITLLRQSNSK